MTPLLVVGVLVLSAGAIVLALLSRRPRRPARNGLVGANLVFIYGPLDGQTYRLTDEITTIGSAPGNTVVVPDPAVSRKHVGIRRDPMGGHNGSHAAWELADLGSTNGVYVNGHRLARRRLVGGDIIRIGASEMVFHLGPAWK